jgi:hypothetical protein
MSIQLHDSTFGSVVHKLIGSPYFNRILIAEYSQKDWTSQVDLQLMNLR